MSLDDASSLLPNALGSASAGIISRLLTHPLDTAKARLQAPIHPPYDGTMDTLRRTARAEGITALYRGFGAIVVGGTPGTMAYLCSYDYFKKGLSSRGEPHGVPEFAIHFMSGMLAEILACVVYVPVDVIKERLQVQRNVPSAVARSGELQSSGGGGGQMYTGSLDALNKILKYEGVRGIYKGYYATLASFGPFSALYFVLYEQLKSTSKTLLEQKEQQNQRVENGCDDDIENVQELPFYYTVLCSASAGAAASWLTSPLDMAKLRFQIQQRGQSNVAPKVSDATTSNLRHRGMMDCLSHIYREGGFRGLFRGAGARVMHFVPATTITMTCYEEFRSFYGNLLSK